MDDAWYKCYVPLHVLCTAFLEYHPHLENTRKVCDQVDNLCTDVVQYGFPLFSHELHITRWTFLPHQEILLQFSVLLGNRDTDYVTYVSHIILHVSHRAD